MPPFFNLSSTVTKARQLLAKDGLTRGERVAQWYRNHPRTDSRESVLEITPAALALARQQIAISLGLGEVDSPCSLTAIRHSGLHLADGKEDMIHRE